MSDATNSNKTKDEDSEEVKPSLDELERRKSLKSNPTSSVWNHRIAVSQGNKTLAVLDLETLGGLPG